VNLLIGVGDGTFVAKAVSAVGGNAQGIYAADVNGDAKLDIVSTGANTAMAYVLLGNGDGTFAAMKLAGATGVTPIGVVAADVTGDGKPDLVVANSGAAAGQNISVLVGLGDGTFAAQKTYSAGNTPSYPWVGDITGDGIPDIVVATSAGNGVSVLPGQASGGFGLPISITAATQDIATAVGDFNGDKLLDVVSTNAVAAGTVSVILQQCK
jgi:hypothetical protein